MEPLQHTEQKIKLKEEKNLKIRSLVNKHKEQFSANEDKFDGIANKKVKLQEELQSRLRSVLPKAASLIPECYVCHQEMRPPTKIQSCGNGHAMCEPCLYKMETKKCGACDSFTFGRMIALEQFIVTVLGLE